MEDSERIGKKPVRNAQKRSSPRRRLERLHSATDKAGKIVDLSGEKQSNFKHILYRSIMESEHILMAVVDRNRRILVTNRAMSEYFHKPVSEFIGRECFREFEKRESICSHCPGRRAMATGRPAEAETEGVRDDGSRIPVRIQAFPTIEPDGTITGFIEIIEDITERKLAEKAVQHSESRFRELFENAPVGYHELDTQGRIVRVNRTELNMLGYSTEEMIGRAVWEFIVEQAASQKAVADKITGVIPPGRAFEQTFRRKDGSTVSILLEDYLLKNEKGQIVGIRSALLDVTNRKQAEQALRDSQRLYVSLVENLPQFIYRKDLEGRFTFGNSRFCELLGRPLQEILGRTDSDLCPAKLAERYREDDRKVIESGVTFDSVKEHRLPNGNKIDIQIVKMPLYNSAREIIGTQGVFWDITERVRAQQEIQIAYQQLHDSQKQFKDMFENSPVGIYRTTPDGRILMANRALVNMLGFSSFDELSRFNIEKAEFGPKYSRSVFKSSIERQGQVTGLESEWTKRDGTAITVSENARAVRDEHGKTLYYEGTIEDITERKKAQEEILALSKFPSENPSPVLRIAKDGGILYSNKPGLELLSHWDAKIGEKAPEKWRRLIKEALESAKPGLQEEEVNDKIFLVTIAPVVEAGYVNLYARNITERKKTQEEVNRRNEELAVLNAVSATASSSLDLRRILDQALEKVLEMTGLESGSMYLLDQKAGEIVLVTYRGAAKEFADEVRTFKLGESLVGRAAQSGQPIVVDDVTQDSRVTTALVSRENIRSFAAIPMKSKDKVQGVMNIASHQYHSFNSEEIKLYCAIGNQIGMSIQNARLHEAIQQDLTERKQAEQRLLSYQAQLRSMASQLIVAEERERRRIAADLHDHIGQALAVSKIRLDALRHSIPDFGELSRAAGKSAETLQEVCSSLGQAVAEIRTLTFDLSSPILHEIGFEAAVAAWLAEQIERKHHIKTEFYDDGQTKPLDSDMRALLFRDVRELLINIVKHANANKIKVSIRKIAPDLIGGQIEVSVEDNGGGFVADEVLAKAALKGSFGLFSIRERLEKLGGRLDIQSEPGHGCKVVMTAPLKQQ